MSKSKTAGADGVTANPVRHYALLSADLGAVRAGHIVWAHDAARIGELIAGGAATEPTPEQIDAAAPLHFPLPEA